MNQEAQDLSRELRRNSPDVSEMPAAAPAEATVGTSADSSAACHSGLPVDIMRLCEDVAGRLRARADAKDWGQVYIRRTMDHQGCTLVLQGFGIPDARSMHRSVVILLLEYRTSHQSDQENGQIDGRIAEARARFRLTERELVVAEHLAQGFTNKEIATMLGITEQTIKVHVKHIMEKTEATTRTGVLAQLFHVSPHPAWDGARHMRRSPSRNISLLLRHRGKRSGASPFGTLAALAAVHRDSGSR
jgi:DNA-binding CsgD family transcriptional regulator